MFVGRLTGFNSLSRVHRFESDSNSDSSLADSGIFIPIINSLIPPLVLNTTTRKKNSLHNKELKIIYFYESLTNLI